MQRLRVVRIHQVEHIRPAHAHAIRIDQQNAPNLVLLLDTNSLKQVRPFDRIQRLALSYRPLIDLRVIGPGAVETPA